MVTLPSLSDTPEMLWVFVAKVIGAICGSAISIAYLLPANRREAFLRFFVGVTMGMIFGTPAGLKLVDYLKITHRVTTLETALLGAAIASLCAWWGLGVLSRLTHRLGSKP